MINVLPSLTVIIPCFNAARFIARTIESVLAQAYPCCRIVVVDDGSSDDSTRVLQEYHTVIDVLRHPGGGNRGQAAALNLGIAHSKSELIAFLDADDIWYRGKLEQQANVFSRHPEIGLVYTNGFVIDEDDRPLHPILDADFVEPSNPEGILMNCYIRTPSMVMVRRSILNQVGGFTEGLQSIDHDMWIRVGEVTSFYFLDQKLTGYRKHRGQQSLRRRQWEDGFSILSSAALRYPYSATTLRRRKAVLYYRLGEHDAKQGLHGLAACEFFMAFLLDPRRALRHVIRAN